jgi:hypothetical protein
MTGSEFASYAEFTQSVHEVLAIPLGATPMTRREALLNGDAGGALRKTVPISARREVGAFFTPEALAHRMAAPLRDVPGTQVVLDPFCGAGDLLLAALNALPESTDGPHAVIGLDVIPEFVAATEARLELWRRHHGRTFLSAAVQADGHSHPTLPLATTVIMNPPYAAALTPPGTTWSTGKVSAAAPATMSVLEGASANCEIIALLPDVLRSGTRYRKWRERVDTLCDVHSVERIGQFDRWTDVDTFLLRARAGGVPLRREASDPPLLGVWTRPVAEHTIADAFQVNVGAVVHNRDPHRGQWHPYLTSRNFPAWETIDRVAHSRRFEGTTHAGPLVVVPRTSSPSERVRTRAAVVTDTRAIAIDNHLIVLRPQDGSAQTCHALVAQLRTDEATRWMNERIRCRHLTVAAIRELPWNQPSSDTQG